MAAAHRELMIALPGVVEATRDADLIVHHASDVTGFAASLVHVKPRITGTLITDFLPGTLAATFMRLGAWFIDGIFNPVLAKAGLSRRRAIALELDESPLLNLVAVSPLIVPPKFNSAGELIVRDTRLTPDKVEAMDRTADFRVVADAVADVVWAIFHTEASTEVEEHETRRSGEHCVLPRLETLGDIAAGVFLQACPCRANGVCSKPCHGIAQRRSRLGCANHCRAGLADLSADLVFERGIGRRSAARRRLAARSLRDALIRGNHVGGFHEGNVAAVVEDRKRPARLVSRNG
jgi:hypothetical protein